MEGNDDDDDNGGDVFGTLRTIYQQAASLGVGKNEYSNSWFPIPMQLYLCSLPSKRLIDGAETPAKSM